METLPNLYFAGFHSKLGNSNHKKIYMVKAARSRQTSEVTTRDSSDQQFLSHDLSKHVAAILLDKDPRSRQRIEVTTRSDVGAKRKLLRQETRMQRQRKSLKGGSCRNIVLDVATLKEDNSCHDKKTMSQQGMIAS